MIMIIILWLYLTNITTGYQLEYLHVGHVSMHNMYIVLISIF